MSYAIFMRFLCVEFDEVGLGSSMKMLNNVQTSCGHSHIRDLIRNALSGLEHQSPIFRVNEQQILEYFNYKFMGCQQGFGILPSKLFTSTIVCAENLLDYEQTMLESIVTQC